MARYGYKSNFQASGYANANALHSLSHPVRWVRDKDGRTMVCAECGMSAKNFRDWLDEPKPGDDGLALVNRLKGIYPRNK